jgi:hypothetical protein
VLLVLYLEYVTRASRPNFFTMSYRQWLDALNECANDQGMTFGEMVAEGIDPVYGGMLQ